MNSGADAQGNHLLLGAIIGGGIALFCLDVYLPLGIGNGVLYGGLVILSFLLPQRKGPIVTAAVCSALDLSDVIWAPVIEGMPRWAGVTSRLLSLTAIWLPVLFFLHRRRAEDALQQAHDELDVRVQERTRELAAVNQTLLDEIADRMETERSLRESEAVLQASQRDLQCSREELRALAGQLLTAQEEDRRRISRDLHDDVNQRLAMLAMDLRRLEKGPSLDAEELRDALRLISDGLTSVSDDVRQMAYRFHPSILDDLGLVKAVRRLVDDFAARTGVKITFVHKDPVRPIPGDITICLYRVAQEALSNIARHAGATQAEVELICEDDLISLSLRDNGRGFDMGSSDHGGHLGVLSMKERVRLAKGDLQIQSSPGHGTHIRVDIPVEGGHHAEAAHTPGR